MSNTKTWLLALVVSKLIVVLTGLAAIARARVARAIFAFFCGVSVLAIAPALWFEYAQSVTIAVLSTVECMLKAACLIAFGIEVLQKKPPKQPSRMVDLVTRQGRPRSDEVIGGG